MITKVLFTSLIILAALIFVRYKGSQDRRQALRRQQEQAENRKTAMFVAFALVSLTMLISGGLYYSHWQEQHRIYTVEVINSHTAERQRYDVYQSDIDGRRFSTIDGVLINLSDSERMEVQAKASEE